MNRDSFILYQDDYQLISLLEPLGKAELLDAIFSYTATGVDPESWSDKMAMVAFAAIKRHIDYDSQKYTEICNKRSEAGKIGGRPKANGFSEKAKKANGFSEKQTKAKKADNDNDSDNDSDNDLLNKTSCAFAEQSAESQGNAMIQNGEQSKATKPKNKQAKTPIEDEQFERFWSAYPKKKSKGDALKAWRQINPNQDLTNIMLKAIEINKGSPDWKKECGQYIPYPATWLRARGWEDEVFEPVPEVVRRLREWRPPDER